MAKSKINYENIPNDENDISDKLDDLLTVGSVSECLELVTTELEKYPDYLPYKVCFHACQIEQYFGLKLPDKIYEEIQWFDGNYRLFDYLLYYKISFAESFPDFYNSNCLRKGDPLLKWYQDMYFFGNDHKRRAIYFYKIAKLYYDRKIRKVGSNKPYSDLLHPIARAIKLDPENIDYELFQLLLEFKAKMLSVDEYFANLEKLRSKNPTYDYKINHEKQFFIDNILSKNQNQKIKQAELEIEKEKKRIKLEQKAEDDKWFEDINDKIKNGTVTIEIVKYNPSKTTKS